MEADRAPTQVCSREDRKQWGCFNQILAVLVRNRLTVVAGFAIGIAPRKVRLTEVVLLRKERLFFCNGETAALWSKEGGEHVVEQRDTSTNLCCYIGKPKATASVEVSHHSTTCSCR